MTYGHLMRNWAAAAIKVVIQPWATRPGAVHFMASATMRALWQLDFHSSSLLQFQKIGIPLLFQESIKFVSPRLCKRLVLISDQANGKAMGNARSSERLVGCIAGRYTANPKANQ
jgi:hypothetical protein